MSEWRQKLDQMRERFPTFMPLVVSRDDGDYVLIGGQEVSWADYCQHIGVPPKIEDRYPAKKES